MLRAVPAGPRGGGRRGRESQRPGPVEAARPWEMACASGRKSSGRRNLGSDSHGGESGPNPVGRRPWHASVRSTLHVSRSSALSPTRGRLIGVSVPSSAIIQVRGTSQPGWCFRAEGHVDGFGLFLTGSSCLQRSLFYRCGTSLKPSENASLPAPSSTSPFAVAFSSVFLFGAPRPGAH